MEEWTFERHALDEMTRDAVSQDEVYTVLGDADVAYVQDNGRTRFDRMMGDGRNIVVIADEETRIVKTVWWDRRASRRRRW